MKQGYTRESDAYLDILKCLQSQASSKKWPVNAKARLALLYLIGKAKSRARVEMASHCCSILPGYRTVAPPHCCASLHLFRPNTCR